MDCCFVKPRASSYRIASALRLTLGRRFAGGSTHQTNFRVGNKSAYSTWDLIQDVKTTHFRQAAHAHRDVPGPSWGNGHYDPMHLPMAPRQRARPGKTIEWGKWFHKTPSFVCVFCLRAIDGNSTSYPVGLRSYQISCHPNQQYQLCHIFSSKWLATDLVQLVSQVQPIRGKSSKLAAAIVDTLTQLHL